MTVDAFEGLTAKVAAMQEVIGKVPALEDEVVKLRAELTESQVRLQQQQEIDVLKNNNKPSTAKSDNVIEKKGCLDLPRWNGGKNGVQYTTWRYEVGIFLEAACSEFTNLLKFLEGQEEMVTEDVCEEYKNDHLTNEQEIAWFSSQLYQLLAKKTADSPQMLVRQEEDEGELRGLTAWQRVHTDAMGWNTAQRRALNATVNSPEKVVKLEDIPRALAQWEIMKKQHEELEKTKMAETQAMAAVQMMLPPVLEAMVRANAHTLKDLESLKKYVCSQCFEAKVPSISVPGAQAPAPKVDIGYTGVDLEGSQDQETWQKALIGELGGAQGSDELQMFQKGKGKGGRFDGTCNFCGLYGHKKQDCQKLTAMLKNGAGF